MIHLCFSNSVKYTLFSISWASQTKFSQFSNTNLKKIYKQPTDSLHNYFIVKKICDTLIVISQYCFATICVKINTITYIINIIIMYNAYIIRKRKKSPTNGWKNLRSQRKQEIQSTNMLEKISGGKFRNIEKMEELISWRMDPAKWTS